MKNPLQLLLLYLFFDENLLCFDLYFNILRRLTLKKLFSSKRLIIAIFRSIYYTTSRAN